MFPATYTLWSQWAVQEERSTLTSIGFCGTNFGMSLAMFMGGALCRYLKSGWTYSFILSGLLGLLWLPLWMWKVSDAPECHRGITEKERDYICNSIGKNSWTLFSIASLPWLHLALSKAVLALLITHSCNLFGLVFFISNFGKLLTEIYQVSADDAGYVLASGYMLMLVCSIVSGKIADVLVKKSLLSLTNVRKLFNSMSSFICGLCISILYFCDESRRIMAITTILVFLFSAGFAIGSGYMVNFADLTPAYSGLLFSISSTLASLASIIGSIIAGIWIAEPVLTDWQNIFILIAIIFITGGVIFLFYGSAVPRKWATLTQQD
ncbi:hypothetical protein I4U23_021936 [Adineta vaga]|nr:hypothetical protein I4U23_021936 [Adineta vaga]